MSAKFSFLLRFAVADLVSVWWRFGFVVLSFAVGVGILVAVSGLSANVGETINEEAKSLLAADVAVSSPSPLPSEVIEQFPSGAKRAAEITFASMLRIPKNALASRLVQVRALSGDYPFYGEAEINPATGMQDLQKSGNSGAVLDAVLAQQFGLGIGDSVKLGNLEFNVIGIISNFPGESYARTVIAPKIFVPLQAVQGSELLARGSRITYKEYLALQSSVEVEALLKQLKKLQPLHRFEIETVETRKKNIERVFNNVSRFLALISLAAVMLGAVGVGGAMVAYIKARLPGIASLRCLGATAFQVLIVYLVQGLLVALAGSALGAGFGLGMQHLLPHFLGEFIPLQFSITAAGLPIAKGILVGVLVSLIFCVWPLLSVLEVSPLQAVRGEDGGVLPRADSRFFTFRLLLAGFSLCGLLVATVLVVGSGYYGLIFAAALVLFSGVLWLLSYSLIRLVRKLNLRSASFAWRYGLSSLHRPQNQTASVVLTLGLAAFILSSIYLSRTMVLEQVSVAGSGDRPNFIMFDVQNDQRAGVRELSAQHGLLVKQEVPIVTMRLLEINGKTNLALREDTEIPEWTLRREYRSSYRASLIESETLLEGEIGTFSGDSEKDLIPVTAEEGIARDLKIKVGAKITFDVQGVPMRTVVTGIRRVDWRRVQTNFFFVFPEGVLEDAPQFFALTARAQSTASIAALQQDLTVRFGNVSAIDLNLILETADRVLSKVGEAVQFLAFFTVVAGLLVLGGSIASTRAARLRELLLLRTIGATRAQLLHSSVVEYFILGLLAACVGVLGSIAASVALSIYFFEAAFVLPATALAIITASVVCVVIVVGASASLGLIRVNPINVLRGAA